MSRSSDRIDEKIRDLARDPCGCLIWPEKPRGGGYAGAWIDGRERRLARYVLEKKLGRPVARNMVAMHSCDNKMCVAEEHLSEATYADNTRDMWSKGRSGYQRGLVGPPSGGLGENHWSSKITEKQAEQIRARYAEGGVSQSALGREFGLTQQTVSGIVNGHFWKKR